MAELCAGSLSHFYLRLLVRGGKGILHSSTIWSSADRFHEGPGQNKFPAGVAPPTPSTETPTILISPVKHRKPGHASGQSEIKASMSDEAVWYLDDDEIIGTSCDPYHKLSLTVPPAASSRTWKSSVYDHYHVSVKRVEGDDRHIDFIFTCKYGSSNHPPQRRRRMGTKDGTGNLRRTLTKCLGQPQSEIQPHPTEDVPYSPAAHRALIALRCAVSKRPFNSVSDPFYAQEVHMLRPGTKLPSPSTVSRDVAAMYENGSEIVKQYFSVSSNILSGSTADPFDQEFVGAVHLVIDGWTSPLMASYLGIVVTWFSGGMLHRWILEFVRYVRPSHSCEGILTMLHVSQFEEQPHRSALS